MPIVMLARRWARNEAGINFRAGQKREHTAAEHRQEVGPFRRFQNVMLAAEGIFACGHDADQNFYQRHRYARADGYQAGHKSQPHPDRRDKPDVFQDRVHKKNSCRRKPAR
jgi:hypothetical protein